MSEDIFDKSLFRHQYLLTVRYADIDMLGHVNHTKYLTYMEQARMAYAQDILGWDGNPTTLNMILARAMVDYHLPLHFADDVKVLTRCSRLGNKSFDLAYLVLRSETVIATGITNMVAFDYQINQTIPVPENWRKGIQDFEV